MTIQNGLADAGLSGDSGGGISCLGSTFNVMNSTISSNSAVGSGGGISAQLSLLNVTNSTISDNQSGAFGGGIANTVGSLILTNSTISGNTAANIGGGIWTSIATATLTNSTVSGNTAVDEGGGIFTAAENSTTNLISSTLTGNSAASGGGILISTGDFPGIVTSTNSLIVNSPSGGNCATEPGATLTPSGNNLDTDGSCAGFTQVSPAQLNLDSLASNGGPTQTPALLSPSNAIDTGDQTECDNGGITTDQRGFIRPIDGDDDSVAICDIGSFEFGSFLDSDGDGVPDDVDECADSDLSPTVVIDGCDSGVPNSLSALGNQGCTISDLIQQIAANSQTHEEFVSGVANLTNALKKAGIITGSQKGEIQSCAAQASIP